MLLMLVHQKQKVKRTDTNEKTRLLVVIQVNKSKGVDGNIKRLEQTCLPMKTRVDHSHDDHRSETESKKHKTKKKKGSIRSFLSIFSCQDR